MDTENCTSAELAAMVNIAASVFSKGKSAEEIEMAALLFSLLADTLFKIALLEKKRQHLQNRQDNTKPKDTK